MARIIAIDYGQKRTGIAVTDTLQMIAGGLGTVPSAEVITYLKSYIAKEQVECFLVGEPKTVTNQPSDSTRFIEPFVKKLGQQIPNIPIVRYDERFTSKLAHRAMLEGGLKKQARANKALVDEISAVILLQDYLESTKYNFNL